MAKLFSSTRKGKGNASEKEAKDVTKPSQNTPDQDSIPKSPPRSVKIQEIKVNVEEKTIRGAPAPSHTTGPKGNTQWSKSPWTVKNQEAKCKDKENQAKDATKPHVQANIQKSKSPWPVKDQEAKADENKTKDITQASHTTAHVQGSSQKSKSSWPVKIQLASDIHLEQNPDMKFQDVIVPSADIFILAGDIGCPLQASYKNFIKECHQRFKHTILIAGNHEYRRSMPRTMEQVDEYLDDMCKQYPNVYYLAHGSNKVVGDVNFIGATMWTPIEDKHFSKDQISGLDHSMSQQKINAKTPWGVKENNVRMRVCLSVCLFCLCCLSGDGAV